MKSKSRGTPASRPQELLARFVGIQVVVLSAALLAGVPASSALAAPAGAQPAAGPLDHGLLGSVAERVVGVADRSTELMGEVRDRATDIVDAAINFLGVRYKRGGTTAETGFDCSGFTRYVFGRAVHRSLPHSSAVQYRLSHKIAKSAIRSGDLVFFVSGGHVYHVGIYAGHGLIWHAPHTGDHVRLARISTSSWVAGRVL